MRCGLASAEGAVYAARMRKAFFSLALLLTGTGLAGCAAEPPPTTATPPVSVTPAPLSSQVSPARNGAPATSVPPVASSAPPASPPVPASLPDPPPGTNAEQVKIAASICAAAYSGKSVGCRSHPPFVRPEQKPDGKIVEHQGDPLDFCAISELFHGSFTKPGKKQTLVSFSQCREGPDAVWDAGFPGSAVLVEEVGGRIEVVATEHEANLDLCLRNRRADGRDFLVCRSGLGAPPAGSVSYFFIVDFGRAAEALPVQGTFARVYADLPMCLPDADTSSGLTSFEIIDMKLAKVNAGPADDLAMKVRRAHAPPSAALEAKAKRACAGGQGLLDTAKLLPRGTPATLTFSSTDKGMKATPATQKLLDTWAKESPEGFNGMAKLGPNDLE